MELLDVIKTRRSRRKYLKKEIPDEIIRKIIDAARHAPFGGQLEKSCQIWEFVLIKNKKIKEQLTFDYEDRQFLREAPVVIAVCADKTKDPDYKDWDITTSLAIENMLLTIHDLGLGACYVTTFSHNEKHKNEKEKMIKSLNLPPNIELVALIPIGYPDPSEKIEKKELRSIDEMMHYDKW
jgi:nitroreductase